MCIRDREKWKEGYHLLKASLIWDNADTLATVSYTHLDVYKRQPQGLFVSGDRIYICDSGNNRIIEIKRTSGTKFELVRIIDEFKGAENNTFNYPTDLARCV